MDDAREFAAQLCRFESTAGEERAAADWLEARLAAFGFETYAWDADADALAEHASFPDRDELDVAGRRSVAGVATFGDDPDAGRTLVLNGHLDVVPADEGVWSSNPFEPTWLHGDDVPLTGNEGPLDAGEVAPDGQPTDTDGSGAGADTLGGDPDRPIANTDVSGGPSEGAWLRARGAADMKAGLTACVYAAARLLSDPPGEGRVVVEGVAGEEDGGFGAATAALRNPYPFERDAAVIAEPTGLTPVVACEGSAMLRLELTGRSAHAATRWRGVDALEKFDRVREAFRELESERAERVTHPLYADYTIPWPVVCGTVEAGEWPSTVPASVTAEWRLGVAPGESVASVEREFRERLRETCESDDWLREHPPTFERRAVQFEPSAVPPDEPIVTALQDGMRAAGLADTTPRGVTYGADARHYVAAEIPAVLFGPGDIEQAHYPDESVPWREVERAIDTLEATVRAYLSSAR